MIIIGGIYLRNVVNRTEQIVTTKTEYLDLVNDWDKIQFYGGKQDIRDDKFQFGFGFTDSSGTLLDINIVS